MPSNPKTRVRPAARLIWTGILVTFLLAACAQNANNGGRGAVELSESEKVALELEQTVGFVNDPELLIYIESIGGRITVKGKRSDVDFRFYILDMPIPNALALPEGQIFVSRGVLVLVNTEDELAGILAHEIAHVEEHHADERQGLVLATSPIRLGTDIAGWATGLIIPGLGEAISELGESTTGLVLAPYSREQEREADHVGQSLAALAGYEPDGLVNLLDTMANAELLDPENAHEQSFFDSHPATAERIALTREHGKSLSPASRPASARDREGVLAMLQGLVIGEDPGKGFFDENWFVHPELAFVMAFPPDWVCINFIGFVGAKAPNEDTFVMLALITDGKDPMEGARVASQKLGIDLVANARLGTVNGLQAAKNQVELNRKGSEIQKMELTWIAYGGLIYQIMGVATLERFEAVEDLMRKSAHSFRPLSDEDRSQILVTRLRVVEGEQGETIAEFAERVGTHWSVEAISVVNRKPATATLAAGELIKVGIQNSYATQPRGAAGKSSDPALVIHRRP
jgi:predicted Zn-dependent protease